MLALPMEHVCSKVKQVSSGPSRGWTWGLWLALLHGVQGHPLPPGSLKKIKVHSEKLAHFLVLVSYSFRTV